MKGIGNQCTSSSKPEGAAGQLERLIAVHMLTRSDNLHRKQGMLGLCANVEGGVASEPAPVTMKGLLGTEGLFIGCTVCLLQQPVLYRIWTPQQIVSSSRIVLAVQTWRAELPVSPRK